MPDMRDIDNSPEAENQLTVGWIRQQVDGLPDDAPLELEWENGPPGDEDPAVVIYGFHVRRPDNAPPALVARVGIQYLDEFDEEAEDYIPAGGGIHLPADTVMEISDDSEEDDQHPQ